MIDLSSEQEEALLSWHLPENEFVVFLALTSHGYGFVSTDERSDDIFVGRKNLKGALNGDTVEVIVLPATRRHRSEGIINQVVARKADQFVGTVIGNRGHFSLLIEPVSPRRGIVLDTKKSDSISDGDIVLAKVTDWGSPNSPVVTKLIERVGSVENAEDDMTVVCYKYDLTPEFPNRVEKESSRWTDQDIKNEIPNRTDLRDLITLTIDPWDARDVDDAISIQWNENGNIVVGVHIADVSFFVREGSELDREARMRGNTVYFAEGTVRMLPDNLSAELCSLLPDVDRLAMSVLMELDASFNVISIRIEKSVIQNKHLFSYREVQKVLDGEKGAYSNELRELNKVAKGLTEKRHQAGVLILTYQNPFSSWQMVVYPTRLRQVNVWKVTALWKSSCYLRTGKYPKRSSNVARGKMNSSFESTMSLRKMIWNASSAYYAVSVWEKTYLSA